MDSYGLPLGFLKVSYGFPVGFLWASYRFLMGFLWAFYGLLMCFLWASEDSVLESCVVCVCAQTINTNKLTLDTGTFSFFYPE